MSEQPEFEQRATLQRGDAKAVRGDGKTLAWRHSEGETKVEIDLELDGEGQPWFSMKRVSGATLAEVIEQLAAGRFDAGTPRIRRAPSSDAEDRARSRWRQRARGRDASPRTRN